MIVVRDQHSAHQISNPQIKQLVQQRINDLAGQDIGEWEFGYFLVIEFTDTIQAIKAQVGFDILCNRFTGIRYDQAEFTPSFEFIEEFPSCYDMVFVLGDDGAGVEVFIPKDDGIDPDLIAMCQQYAVKAAP